MVLPASPGTRRGVFVSYSRKDGEVRAGKIRDLLEHEDIPVWQDRSGMEGGRDWWEQIRQALNHVEFMVLVMTQAAIASPTVEKEWRYARQQGVCVYPVIADPALDFASLPRWMRDAHWYDLAHQQAKFLNDLRTRCQARRVPFMVEDLPEDFVARDAEFDALKSLLLTPDRGDPVAVTAALRGAGGYGKTTLARALCHDEDVQNAFDDGVLWATLGEVPSEAALLKTLVDLIETLSGERPGFEGLDAAAARFREELAGRDILLVIDDAWRNGDLRHFLQGGDRCARLITTRRADTVPQSARNVPVDEMRQAEAEELIAQGLPQGSVADLSALAMRLGGWPLLLKLVNAQLRKHTGELRQPLPAAVAWVGSALDRRGLVAFDARDPQQRNDAVAHTLELSLEGLTESERERLLELAVFPEDLKIPFVVLERYWGHTGALDAFEVEETCLRLYGESLLLQCDINERYIRLHDAVRAWLIERPGELAMTQRHGQLLAAYETEGTRWEDVPDDGYLHAHLAEHLAKAGRRDELHRLLLSLDWMHVRLGTGQANQLHARSANIPGLVHDYDFLPDASELGLLRRALRQSMHVLLSRPDALEQQLYGRLASSGLPPIRELFQQLISRGAHFPLFPLRPALIPPGHLDLTLAGHEAGVTGVLLLDEGRRALSWSKSLLSHDHDHTLRLWDLASGEALATLVGHEDEINGVLLLDEGRRALSWSEDRTLRLWDMTSGQALATLAGHVGPVRDVLLLDEGRRALSWSDWLEDYTLRLWDLASGQALATLTGQYVPVYGVLLLDEGRRALSWSWGRTLRLWDLTSGQALVTLAGHEDEINGVLLLDEGRRALSWSEDRTLRLWDLASGQALATLAGHVGPVRDVLLLDEGRRAFSWSDDHTLRLWDLASGQALVTLAGHEDEINGVLLLDEGRRALSWSEDRTLRLWDLASGQALATLAGHVGPVTDVLLLDEGRRALSWSNSFLSHDHDHTLRLWDLASGQALGNLVGHEDQVNGVQPLDEGRRALSWSRDRTLRLWDLASGQALGNLARHADAVGGVLLLDEGRRALSWSRDHTLRLWDLGSGQTLATLVGHEDAVYGVLLLDEGRRALSWSEDRTLRLWDLASGRALATLAGHYESVTDALLLNEGRQALSWSQAWSLAESEDYTVRLWDLASGQALATLAGHVGQVKGVLLRDEGRQALSWSRDHTLRLWDLGSGQALATLSGHAGQVKGVLLLDEGRRALSWSEDRTLRLWDLDSGQALATLSGHAGQVKGVLLLDEGRRALSWSEDRTLRLWDLDSGQALATLVGHVGPVRDVLMLDEGRRGLSWSDDHTLRLWDLASGQALVTLAGHEDEINGVLLLDEGRRALSWSRDHTLRLWDLGSGQALATLVGHADKINGVLLLDEGRQALSWSEDRTLRLWDIKASSEVGVYFADAKIRRAIVDPNTRMVIAGDASGGIHLLQLRLL